MSGIKAPPKIIEVLAESSRSLGYAAGCYGEDDSHSASMIESAAMGIEL